MNGTIYSYSAPKGWGLIKTEAGGRYLFERLSLAPVLRDRLYELSFDGGVDGVYYNLGIPVTFDTMEVRPDSEYPHADDIHPLWV